MKRLLVSSVLLVFSVAVAAAQQTTPYINMTLPNYAQPNWNLPLNTDLGMIDTAIGHLQVAFKGAWSGTAIYNRGDQVTYNSVLYVSTINSNFNSTPGVGGGWLSMINLSPASPIPGLNGDGHNGIIVTGNFLGPTVNSSINSQINVMAPPYNAYGDCNHDDTATVAAAQAAAIAAAPGQLPEVLYFPKPPGGCYIINELIYQGVPLIGQQSGLGPASPHYFNVKFKSTNGHDILAITDPSLVAGVSLLQAGWTIQNISFEPDSTTSTVGMYPHRWPGRWYDGTSMTSGSTTITTANPILACGDMGQAITVGGAGATVATTNLAAAITTTTQSSITLSTGYVTGTWPSVFMYLKIDSEIVMAEVQGVNNGATIFTVFRGQAGTTAATHTSGASVTVMGNLTTTVSTVTPCFNGPGGQVQTATLAAPAQNTISNAHTYISVLGLPVTTNIGNCAIAADMYDGNKNDWKGSFSGGNYPRLENVVFTESAGSVTGSNTCAMYMQGQAYLYGAMINNFGIYATTFGIVQQGTEINSIDQPSSGDYEQWNHGLMFFAWNPWISSNGLSQRWTDVQISGSTGPQILSLPNIAFDYAQEWHVSNSGFETPSNCTPYGWRIEGQGHTFDGVSLSSGCAVSGGGYQNGYWDANSSTINVFAPQSYLNGYGNQGSAAGFIGGTNRNNQVWNNYLGNPFGDYPLPYNVSGAPYKGTFNMIGRFTGDFAFDGNPTTTYTHDDLIIWPNDIYVSPAMYNATILQDTTSPSGSYINMLTGYGWSQFFPYIAKGVTGNSLIIGTDLPATGVTIAFEGKCLSGSSFQFGGGAFGGSGNSQTFPCTTSYQQYALPVTFKTSDIGKFFSMGGQGSTVWQASYFVIVPFKGNYNGYPVQPADGRTTSFSPATWQMFNMVTSPDATSPTGYSTAEHNTYYISSYHSGSTNLNGGAMYPAVQSTATYVVGAPTVITDTLNGSISNSATSVTVNTASTSTWASNGCFLVDQEVMCYSGTLTTGTTTFTVTRGQYGTIAQAHSTGATLASVGTANLQIVCNSTVQSSVPVYYAATMNTFSGPFAGQNCSGYATEVAYLSNPNGPTGQLFNIGQVSITQENGYAPINSPAFTGTPTVPNISACSASAQAVNAAYVAMCGGTASIASGGNYALPFYGSAPSTTVGPSNITSDSTGNNLKVPGNVSVGSSPPTVCGTGTVGCHAFSEGSTACTPTAGQDCLRADAGTHQFVVSLNGGAEQPLVSTGGIANIQITTGTASLNPLSCTAETPVSMTGLLTTSAITQPTATGGTDPTTVSGWAPGGTLYLSFRIISAGSLGWRECNASSTGAVAAGASITWNVGVR